MEWIVLNRAAAGVAAAGLLALAGDRGAPVRNVDAPLLRISCDELPLTTPTPMETREDESARPYHALIRVWSFPSREPLDVPVERFRLIGASASARVGPGEYLFSDISVGFTSVTLLDALPPPPVPGATRAPAPGRRAMAGRNPLVLARRAITVCDLFVPDEARLDDVIALRGVVVDRADGRPVEGARIACGSAVLESGGDGRFEFPADVTWRDLLTRTAIAKPGWRRVVISPLALSAPWVERLLEEGEAAFTLVREDDANERAPELLPPLGR